MAQTYNIVAVRQKQIRTKTYRVGEADTITLNFNGYANDFGTVTAVTWSVVCGDIGISSEALASNQATAVISINGEGDARIKAVATAGNNTYVFLMDILGIDNSTELNDDYDLHGC